MAATEPNEQELRSEVREERTRLAEAGDTLRAELGQAPGVGAKLRAQRPAPKAATSRSSGPAASRIAADTAAAGNSSSTTKAMSCRTSGNGLTGSTSTAWGAALTSASRSSSNAPQTPSRSAGCSSPSQP